MKIAHAGWLVAGWNEDPLHDGTSPTEKALWTVEPDGSGLTKVGGNVRPLIASQRLAQCSPPKPLSLEVVLGLLLALAGLFVGRDAERRAVLPDARLRVSGARTIAASEYIWPI